MGALAGVAPMGTAHSAYVALLFCPVRHFQDEISELELDGLIEKVLC